MTVALTIILIGAVTGAVAACLVAQSAPPEIDDPHVPTATVRRTVRDHPLVQRLARALPERADVALAESVAVAGVMLIALAALVGVFLVMIRTGAGLVLTDTPVARWAADNATERSTTIMRELSKFGGTAYVVVAAVAVAVYAVSRDRRWSVVLFVAITMIGQFAVSNSIKWSVDRARPDLSNLTGYSGTSFPSGHAVAAAAAWTCVAFLLGRGRPRRVRAALFGLAVALGVIVAGTRVALGVHWTTDVIVGVVIGWVWFAVCATLFGGRRLRPAEPLVVAKAIADDEPVRGSRRLDR